MPLSPARPNGVRAPSMKTTSRSTGPAYSEMVAAMPGRAQGGSTISLCSCASLRQGQLLAQLVQVLAIGVEHLAVELEEHVSGHPQLAGVADVEQAAEVAEAIVRRV